MSVPFGAHVNSIKSTECALEKASAANKSFKRGSMSRITRKKKKRRDQLFRSRHYIFFCNRFPIILIGATHHERPPLLQFYLNCFLSFKQFFFSSRWRSMGNMNCCNENWRASVFYFFFLLSYLSIKLTSLNYMEKREQFVW